MKKDTIEGNHWLTQWSAFDVRIFTRSMDKYKGSCQNVSLDMSAWAIIRVKSDNFGHQVN